MHGVKYTRFVGDKDSHVFRTLQESMPFVPDVIEKIECRNHLLRNYIKTTVLNNKSKYKCNNISIYNLVQENTY